MEVSLQEILNKQGPRRHKGSAVETSFMQPFLTSPSVACSEGSYVPRMVSGTEREIRHSPCCAGGRIHPGPGSIGHKAGRSSGELGEVSWRLRCSALNTKLENVVFIQWELGWSWGAFKLEKDVCI